MGMAAPTPQCDREVGAIIAVSVLFGVTLLALVFLAAYASKYCVALPAAAGASARAAAGAGAAGDHRGAGDVEAVQTWQSVGTSDVFLTARTGASSMGTCSSFFPSTSSRLSSLAPVARVRVGDRILTSRLAEEEDSVTGSYSMRDLEARLQALKQ
jgi:hypothetical protein